MRILTLDPNMSFELDQLPNEIGELNFCVLDNSNPKEPDFFYIPLVFMESFNSPALVLKIGKHTIKMPVDWQILIGEPDAGDLELIPLTSVNDRGFKAYAYNPRSSFRQEFFDIEIVDIYQDVRWYFPKLKSGQLLAVPLEEKVLNPWCVYFVKDISRQSEVINYSLIC